MHQKESLRNHPIIRCPEDKQPTGSGAPYVEACFQEIPPISSKFTAFPSKHSQKPNTSDGLQDNSDVSTTHSS